MRELKGPSLDRLRTIAATTELPPSPDPRYSLTTELGRGGMGVVYLATDQKLEREVALKTLRPDVDPEALRARIVREARILARLEHPGIVPIYDVGPLEGDSFHYTMKRIDGEPLDRHLERHPHRNERLRLFLRLCEPIAFAHARGVIHRDLKPGNVMIGSFGEVVVLDWGIAKLEDAPSPAKAPAPREAAPPSPGTGGSDATTVVAPPRSPRRDEPAATGLGQVLGTPGYMAPEQLRGDSHTADAQTDVYALGVILRELLAQADPGIDRRLRAIVAQATAEEPEGRYDSVLSLSEDVSRYLDGESIQAYREGPIEKLRVVIHRYRTPITLVLTYLVVRVLVHLFGDA